MPGQAAPPAAIFTDPPHDAAHPARSETLAIPTGGVLVNGLAYIAAGPGPHPTLVIAHGWPGNEKNIDIAQSVRRAGWNTVVFNYRGAWAAPVPSTSPRCHRIPARWWRICAPPRWPGG